jgi:hypothetical protein
MLKALRMGDNGLRSSCDNNGDGGPAPEAAAILSHLPADAVGTAFSQCGFDFIFRLAVANVFRREQAGEMLPDDFAGLITEQALRARVPTHQPSVLL